VQNALQASGVQAAAVLNTVELLQDPHVLASDGFEFVETPAVGPTPYPRVAFRLSGSPVPVSGPAPAFGEANDYVLEDVLGHSAEEVQALLAKNVIAAEPQGAGH
jgi:formyl-CoA transferase